MEQGTRRVRRWLGLLIIAVAMLGALAVTASAPSRPAAAEPPTGPPINAVYLAHPERPGLDIAQARQAGLRVVTSVPELMTEAATAEAIVID